MKKLQSTFKNMVLSLGIISVVLGGVLAYANYATRDKIAQMKEKALNDGIKQVMLGKPDGDLTIASVKDMNNAVVYVTTNAAGDTLGAAVKATVNGFGDNLVFLVGFNQEGHILGYQILESKETPGLGAKAGEWFQKGQPGDVIDMNPGEAPLTVSKDGGKVNAITASTITSRAFLKGINTAYKAFRGEATDGDSGASKVHHGNPAPQPATKSAETSTSTTEKR